MQGIRVPGGSRPSKEEDEKVKAMMREIFATKSRTGEEEDEGEEKGENKSRSRSRSRR